LVDKVESKPYFSNKTVYSLTEIGIEHEGELPNNPLAYFGEKPSSCLCEIHQFGKHKIAVIEDINVAYNELNIFVLDTMLKDLKWRKPTDNEFVYLNKNCILPNRKNKQNDLNNLINNNKNRINLSGLKGQYDLLGRIGENTYFQDKTPIQFYQEDLDNNGVKELIYVGTYEDKQYPIAQLRELKSVVPSLRKQFPKHADFAGKTIEELFPMLAEAEVETINELRSGIQVNDTTFIPFPPEAQYGPINAICELDINKDGHTDLITGGNYYNIHPKMGQFDGGYLLLMLGDGEGNFTPISPQESGLWLTDEISSMVIWEGKLLLTTRTDLVVYEFEAFVADFFEPLRN